MAKNNYLCKKIVKTVIFCEMKNESLFKISGVVIIMAILAEVMVICSRNRVEDGGFVYVEDGVFKIDGETFFPMMLNYKVEMLEFDDDLVFAAAEYYDYPDKYEPTTKEEAMDQFSGHMQLIEELGFNTVRLCMNVVYDSEEGKYYKTQCGRAYLKKDSVKIIVAVDDIIRIAASHNLKVMLLLKPSWDNELSEFNTSLMQHLSCNVNVFAFDLMNEPLYFDDDRNRLKSDAVRIASQWIRDAKKAAPRHLVTIGFAEPIETFSWDASMIPVDFVAFHTYNPLSIPNETWWWSRYIGKPWMIGETSLPADNDSVTYGQQCLFAEQVFRYVLDCGGIGFGWWEFQDLPVSYNINYEGTYSGLLNHEGTTVTKDGSVIQGTLKPVAHSFAGFKHLEKGEPRKAVNYYNNFGYHNAMITGRIVDDKTGAPIEGAVVRGWNNTWRTGLNTFTDENGVFNLYSNDENVHFAISAPGMDTKRFDRHLEYRDRNGEVSGFTNLPDRNVKSSMVSYGKFLKDDTRLFEFEEGEFDKAVIFADMGEIRLESLVLE